MKRVQRVVKGRNRKGNAFSNRRGSLQGLEVGRGTDGEPRGYWIDRGRYPGHVVRALGRASGKPPEKIALHVKKMHVLWETRWKKDRA